MEHQAVPGSLETRIAEGHSSSSLPKPCELTSPSRNSREQVKNYPNVDMGYNDRETLLREGKSAAIYERQLGAYGFLSQTSETKTGIGRFRRSNSPGECWGGDTEMV